MQMNANFANLTSPADILLSKYRVRHIVFVNNRRYVVSWQTKDNVNKYYLEIVGERQMIVPSTVHLAPAYHQYTSVRVDIDPCGRLGKKILAELGITPASFGY
jgi:hypothetical protein